MVQENFQSINRWQANCNDNQGGLDNIKDLDYRVSWGNNGTLTIVRHNLIEIEYNLKAWNSKDGWIERINKRTLPNPVEEYTFEKLADAHAFADDNTLSYFSRRYIITGIFKIKFGETPGEIEEVYSTTVNGCFRRYDPYYYDHFGCTPPDVLCEES